MKKYLFSSIALVYSLSAYPALENTSTVKIEKISGYEDSATIEFSPDFNNSQNCTHSSIKNLASVSFENGSNDELYSLILSAATAKNEVVLYINGCHSSGIPLVYRVDVTY